MIHFLNGNFVTVEELSISPQDLGFSRGFAVHDFIVTNNNKPFKVAEHVDRLLESAYKIGLKHTYSRDYLIQKILETFDKNPSNIEKTMRIYLTGGISHTMRQAHKPTLMFVVNERNRYAEDIYQQGIKVIAEEYIRPYPNVKHNFYVEAIKGLSAINSDVQDIIYYGKEQVYEGSGCNIFAVINDILVTPQSNIVKGITRNTLLNILRLNIPIKEQDFSFNELLNASEVFVTGSNSEVRGVIEINGKKIGNGCVGDITKECLRQYREYIK